MARGLGRPSSGRVALSELQPNGDPPQSTLAAQLVNRLADGNTNPRDQGHEAFRQLLNEILDAERDDSDQVRPQEANNDVDCKLIYVVVKAGLEALTSQDPFSKQGERDKQCVDSLAAVRSTLKRNPGVLYAHAPAQLSDTDRHGPLFLWLIPKLLTVLASDHDGNVTNGTLNLLKAMFSVDKKIKGSAAKKYSIRKYMKDCVKGEVFPPHPLLAQWLRMS